MEEVVCDQSTGEKSWELWERELASQLCVLEPDESGEHRREGSTGRMLSRFEFKSRVIFRGDLSLKACTCFVKSNMVVSPTEKNEPQPKNSSKNHTHPRYCCLRSIECKVMMLVTLISEVRGKQKHDRTLNGCELSWCRWAGRK